ncbi:UDP-N-acetylglucosamine 2-epimerase [Nonomuraea sp. NPDC050310]|uniref:UDP-N-acetylglucosamine 2-epimerase n=1 Tax=Nonomuraea sp. NPDC050310 TaxID=3154935 RepID=UPI003407315A
MAVVVGARSEAVKLGVVVRALQAQPWAEVAVIGPGRRGEAVEETLALFGARVDRRLADVRRSGRPGLAGDLVTGLGEHFAALRPDLVVVQGDTTSALASGLAAQPVRIRVVHVEAGLRSRDALPFPQEIDRRLAAPPADLPPADRRPFAPLADLHLVGPHPAGLHPAALYLAPTRSARDSLVAERIAPAHVIVTGSTAIDALMHVVTPRRRPDRPLALVIAHRPERGEPRRRIARVAARLATERPGLDVVTTTPLGPEEAARGPANLRRLPPLPYQGFVNLLATATLVITDSGEVEEAAASLRLPLLVMRETTERREALLGRWAHLVGTEEELILKTADAVLAARPPGGGVPRPCVFGDGRAAERTVAACGWLLGLAPRPADFHPPG